ncbi:methyltransferase [Lactobacillus nasalidis]|uniref:Methyltransferase n=1 Tax=Lactobacillus nasalidis TaxID=2797258 RepID=A0ABQ3W8I5_9LACO|nr:class I SAM-dependent methyltransferase [Lactobacillus nasalidis]GHV97137.1 methyltransferase [Lactobacillus nasalidis]GHV99124.1 methyltransferase [Lactobacillus nasalidis]GHW01404.1 methyltransferase [Lactobacillus nasalidis]
MNLRLNKLAEMVDPGSRVADIGTDHAYLPIRLVQSGKISHAIASDVAAGPLANAKADIASAGLADAIETRLGSGLETIKEEDGIDTVVIAGMGGKLMVSLLAEAAGRGVYYPTLVLEANIGENTVRRWLMENKYEIVAEDIVDEAGHIYELIKARLTDRIHELSVREQEFGPLLLAKKTDVFYKKWRGQEAYYQKLLANLNKARQKDEGRIKEIEDLLAMIEEELSGAEK